MKAFITCGRSFDTLAEAIEHAIETETTRYPGPLEIIRPWPDSRRVGRTSGYGTYYPDRAYFLSMLMKPPATFYGALQHSPHPSGQHNHAR